MGKKPTEPQIGFLENRGIIPLETRSQCSRLISYIKYGNQTSGRSDGERTAIVKKFQKKFVGQEVIVKQRKGDPIGTVRLLTARTVEEVEIIKNMPSRSVHFPHPFNFLVDFENEKGAWIQGGNVELVVEDPG